MKDNNPAASSLTARKMDLCCRHIKLWIESTTKYVMASDKPIGVIRVSRAMLAL